jgi:ubiquinone biosynthesis protein
MLSILTAIRDIDRARQITTVLVKHGFGELVQRIGWSSLLTRKGDARKGDDASAPAPDPSHISMPQRLRLVLQDLGPSFIKLGQIISTRPDIIPADIITELKKLQDDVKPVPFDEVKATVEASLGAPILDLFLEFDPSPLASASIGQVHTAKVTLNGQPLDVVVKVQRAGLRAIIERDIDLLYIFARLVERAIPEARIYSPVGLVREFDQSIMAELDFNVEADNAERFIQHFQSNPYIRFPKPHRDLCSRQVLTQERFYGKKIDAALADGYSGELLAKNSLHVIAKMIYEDGFFHADPHPGNILILGPQAAPVVGMLDLGLVGRLSITARERIIDLMVAAIRNDTDGLADALLALGKPQGRLDLPAFRAHVALLSERYLNRPLSEIEISALIRDLVQGAVKFNIEMPTDLLMMGKALMTIEGIGKQLYPALDVYTELRPYFLKLVWNRYHPQRVAREALKTLGQVKDMAVNLPSQLNTIFEDIRSGRLEVRTQDPSLPAAAQTLAAQARNGLTIAGTLIAACLLLASGRQETLGWILLCAAAALWLLCAMSRPRPNP